MGAVGTDAAIEAADIALMADDLTKVVYAINLGRTARKISGQNIVFSLFILAILYTCCSYWGAGCRPCSLLP
jgi:Cd2+/Zn2+-exporting ATPase